MNLNKQYAKEIYKSLNYHATWFPNEVLKLGDIGYVKDCQFEYITSLEDLNIPYEVRTETTPADLEYSSAGGVSMTVKIAGDQPVPGSCLAISEAGISLHFENAHAVVFRAAEVEVITIKNKNRLAEAIADLRSKDDWPSNQVVITSLVRCKSATVLVSNDSGGVVELAAQGGIPGAGVANLKTSNVLKYASKIGVQIIAEAGLTPLFKISGFRRSFFFVKESFVNRGGGLADIARHDPVDDLQELSFEDLEE